MIWTRRSMITASAALALSGCLRKPAHPPLSIGFQKNGLLFLAKARGVVGAHLEAQGFGQPHWVEFTSGPPMMEAMAAGGVDIGAVGESPPIFAQAAGAPIRYIASQPISGAGSAIILPRGSSIASLKELKGRRVAFTRGSSAHLLLAKALIAAGLGFGDIVPINLNPADASGAFASGAIDAWSIWDPYYAIAQAQHTARTLITGTQLPPSSSFYIGSVEATRGKAESLIALLRALREEAVWAEQNEDAAVDIVAKQNGLPPAIVKTSLRNGRHAADPIDAATIRLQQANVEVFAKAGIIPRTVDVASSVWHPQTV